VVVFVESLQTLRDLAQWERDPLCVSFQTKDKPGDD